MASVAQASVAFALLGCISTVCAAASPASLRLVPKNAESILQGGRMTSAFKAHRMSLRGGAPVDDGKSAGPKLQIVFVSAEVAPWSVTGGLGAVRFESVLHRFGSKYSTI